MKGIAWGGGGLGVARVDVSVDGGEHFTRAELLTKPIAEKRKSQWSWQFFEKTVPLSDSVRCELCAFAFKPHLLQGKVAGGRAS